MNNDIVRIEQESKGKYIVTKYEWMVAAIEELEQNDSSQIEGLEEEPISTLYESLYIDPNNLTPF